MNKKAASLILLFTITTTAAIPLAAIVGVGGAILAEVIAQYIFALQQKVEYLEDTVEWLNETLTGVIADDRANVEYMISAKVNDTKAEMLLLQDLGHETDGYAWTLAKYTALKRLKEELNNGTDFATALGYARADAAAEVKEYYQNVMGNVVADFNETNEEADLMLRNLAQNAVAAATSGWLTFYEDSGITYKANDVGSFEIVAGSSYAPLSLSKITTVTTKTYTCGDLTFNYELWQLGSSSSSYHTPEGFGELETEFINAMNAYCNVYTQIDANLDAYMNSLTQEIYDSGNVSELLDPVTLATQINNDLNQTGYYGYAAAELAMLGLNLTGLNKTIAIELDDGMTLRGILFTDWEGTLEKNQTYHANESYLWYFVDEYGQLYDLGGYNFTVTDLRDKDGNPLNSTTFVRYVDHSGDIQKIYDELAKLNELYSEYLEMQALMGGRASTGDSISDWWNSLSDTEKLAIAGAAVLFIVLIARR